MLHASRGWIRVFFVVLASIAPGVASAQVCIEESVSEDLFACAQGSVRAPRRGAHDLPDGTRDAPVVRRPQAEPEVDLDPTLMRAPANPRERRYIERELTVLRRLARETPARRPAHADVLRRLASTLEELVRIDETRARSLDEPIFRARQRPTEVRSLRQTQREAERAAREAREEAIVTLAQLVRDHPRDRHLDEPLFALAYHLERSERAPQARQVYHRLLRDFPQSRFVPHAYLAFAEHHFARGELDDARQFYERVLAIDADHNPLFGFALYKLAWVHVNAERHRESLETFVRVIEHVRAHPDASDSRALGRQTRREIVIPYAQSGRPDRALSFFRRFADSEQDALAMLGHLGELYFDTGQWPQTIAVHHELMGEQPNDDSLCEWQLRILDATISSRPKDDQVREARRLGDVRRLFRAGSHPREAIASCDERTATQWILLATAWHREAIGTDTQPGTRDANTMRLASDLYDLIVGELPELDAMTLREIDARDRPRLAHLAFFQGELLYEGGRWAECARAYTRALDSNPDAELAADASYGAVLCYDRVLGERALPPSDHGEALEARVLDADEERMARTFARFACVAPQHEELPIVLYRWARLYYEANQFDRAALLFRRVAIDHARSEVGVYAANLYLDSLNVLYERRSRETCFATIGESLAPLSERYCADGGEANPDLCGVIDAGYCTSEARSAETLGRRAQHREAAEAYVRLVRQRQCPEEDVYLFNAAMHFEAARLIGRAIRVRTTLIEAFPDSRLVPQTIYFVGANYHALAIYGEAAEWYERYAREQGRSRCADCPDPAEGLRHAALFRLGLGETDAAIEDARQFELLFRRTQPRMTAEVVFAMGAVHEGAARWSVVIDHYRRFLREHSSAATPDQLARANVAIARAYISSGDRDRALPFLSRAVAIRDEGGEEAIRTASTADEDRLAATFRLQDAVSEALFELAEAERERFDAIAFPILRGRASIARVNEWAAVELRAWLEAKEVAFRVAEAAYARVHPLLIPRWRIASASRLGDMRISVAERLRESPIPDVYARDPELLQIIEDALDDVIAPIERSAVTLYENCLTTATRARWFDARSQRCEEALNSLDPARFPIASELRGQPGYGPSDAAEPGPPTG